MAEYGKYLYCVIACPEDRIFGAAAIGGNGKAVHTVCHQGLAAVVSSSPETRYESTRQNMIAHERVIETVMAEFTLLPVRFGTVTDSDAPLRDMQRLLARRGDEFRQLLQGMEGKVELGIKALWRDEKAIFAEIVAENPGIKKLRHALSGKSAAAVHFDGVALGRMVKESLDKKRSQEATRILSPLRQIAYRTRENDVLIDRMIVNAAFLVEKEREQSFDQAVRRLDEELGQRVILKYIGPTPPYNFVNLVVSWEHEGAEK